MKKLLHILPLIVVFVFSYSGYCQQKDTVKVWAVSGKTVEIKNKKHREPLPLSHITAVNSIDKSNYRATSLDDGSFRMVVPEGKYDLAIENIGHKTFIMKLDVIGQDVDLGEIALQIGEELEAASIKVRSLVHRHGTRISYDVVHDPDKSKINMTEMISRIPGLNMSNRTGNLEYNNQVFNKILIDESESGLISADRQYPMEFIKAHYMKRIEVVLPGDPEYKNDQPLLLISLAQKLPFGAAAQLSQNSTSLNSYSQGIDAVVNAPIMGIGVGYSFGFDRAPTATNESITKILSSDSEISRKESEQSSWSRSLNHKINTDLFRNFANERIRFVTSIYTSYNESKSQSKAFTRTYDSDNTLLDDNSTISHGKSTSPFRFNIASHLSGNLKGMVNNSSPLSRARWSVKYSLTDNDRDNGIEYSSFDQQSISKQKEHKFQSSLKNIRLLEGPVKINSGFSLDYYKRDYYSYDSYSGSYSNTGFDYDQSVANCKVELNMKALKNRLVINGSLSADNVDNEGVYIYGNNSLPLDNHSFTLEPNIMGYFLSTYGSISFWYNRKLTRPDIKKLSPYEDHVSPYLVRTGNPKLKGQTTDFYSADYSFHTPIKWIENISLSASYSTTKNLVNPITTVRDDGVSVSTYYNYGTSDIYSARLFVSGKPLKTLSFSMIIRGSRSSYTLPSGNVNRIYHYGMSSNVKWTNDYFELSSKFGLSPRGLSAQSSKMYLDPSMQMSVSRYFKKPKIGVSIDAYDLLRSCGQRKSVIEDVNFIERRNNYSYGRYVGFSIFWRIGAFKNAESVVVEEVDR